jgi:hypothetical protein
MPPPVAASLVSGAASHATRRTRHTPPPAPARTRDAARFNGFKAALHLPLLLLTTFAFRAARAAPASPLGEAKITEQAISVGRGRGGQGVRCRGQVLREQWWRVPCPFEILRVSE